MPEIKPHRVYCSQCHHEIATMRQSCDVSGLQILCRDCYGIEAYKPRGGRVAVLPDSRVYSTESDESVSAVG